MSGNPARVAATQQRRRSNAAGPHASLRRGEVDEPDYAEREQIGVARVAVPGQGEHLSPVYGVTRIGDAVLVEIRGQRRYVPRDWCTELDLDEGAA